MPNVVENTGNDVEDEENIPHQYRIERHHIRPDTQLGINCFLLCGVGNALRDKAIEAVYKFKEQFGDFKINDKRAVQFGIPLKKDLKAKLDKDGKVITPSAKNPWKGNIWQLNALYHMVKDTDEFRCGLNTKILKQTLSRTSHEFSASVKAIRAFHREPDKFKAKPEMPKCRGYHRQITMTIPAEAISFKENSGYMTFGNTHIEIPDIGFHHRINEVQIVPSRYGYNINVVYMNTRIVPDIRASHVLKAGLDFGVCLLCMLASNDPSVRAAMVGANHATYINRKTVHTLSNLKRKLPEDIFSSSLIQRVEENHKNRMHTFMHTVSKRIIEWCLANGIGELVVGYNKGWKQFTNFRKGVSRRFQQIPFRMLLNMIEYKCYDAGINLIVREESHTSKCSFIDNEKIEHHDKYAGKRVKRGLFRSKDGVFINADHNGALNILRKEFGNKIFQKNRKLYTKQYPHNIKLQQHVMA